MKPLVIFAVSTIFLSGCSLTILPDSTDGEKPQAEINLTNGRYELVAGYYGNSEWDYQITGTMPSPCYSFKVDTVVMESFPEQVHINVTEKEPGEDEICSQVVTPITQGGGFEASQEAEVTLNVN